MSKVREAMVPEPRTLDAESPATEAGELLAGRRCTRSSSRGTASPRCLDPQDARARDRCAGLDPKATTVGEIAEPAHYTIDSDMELEEAFRFLEEQDAERVPVVEDGRLVGVLARELVQRRLAEDEPPEPLADAPA